MFSVHQPGNDSVRAFLLESGLPILPRFLSVARRRRAAGDVELQVHRYARNGNYRTEPGTEVVPPVQTSRRRRGFFLSLPNSDRKIAFEQGNFCSRAGFIRKATRLIARRRLCDAKTQITIPGAQPSLASLEVFARTVPISEAPEKSFWAICTPISCGLRFSLTRHAHGSLSLRRLRTTRIPRTYCAADTAPGMD